MPADTQGGVVTVKSDREPLGLQRRPDVVHPRRVERRERDTPPHGHRGVEQCVGVDGFGRGARPGRQLPKRVQIDRRRIRRQHIATGLARDLHTMAAERLPEPGQVAGQGVSGTVRQFVGPDPLDQLV